MFIAGFVLLQVEEPYGLVATAWLVSPTKASRSRDSGIDKALKVLAIFLQVHVAIPKLDAHCQAWIFGESSLITVKPALRSLSILLLYLLQIKMLITCSGGFVMQ